MFAHIQEKILSQPNLNWSIKNKNKKHSYKSPKHIKKYNHP